MTDEKICPFMSRPYISCISGKDECGTRTQYTDVEYVECQKDRCMAWGKMHVIDYDNSDPDSPCIIIEGCRLIP